MERKVNFKNSKGKNLVGILHTPKENTESLVVLAHGFTSNKSRDRYIEIGNALTQYGYAFLRFDFSGSGESNEGEITVKNQIDDLKSAINFVKSKGYTQLGLIGESLGGLISVLVYPSYIKDIRCMGLVAPVTQGKIPDLYDAPEISVEIKEKGFYLKYKDGKVFKVPKEYIEERKNVNQKKLLSKIKCPVLIIHGSEDDTVPISHSKDAMKYLPRDSKLKLIEGANHDLDIKHGIVPIISNWFREHLR